MDISASDYELKALAKINVILGKNGCGKSTLLKAFEQSLQTEGDKKYITPERGGVLTYEPNVEQNWTANAAWLGETRRRNQARQFREQSIVQFRRLELAVLRASEQLREVGDFAPYIEQLNGLLDNIEVRRVDPSFKLFVKSTGVEVQPDNISSGEAELISLGIEVSAFAQPLDVTKDNFLFLDEPDVHLHPDLQARLVGFLVNLVNERKFTVVIATHSTAILGGLANYNDATVTFMRAGDGRLTFEPIGGILRRVLPVFGAHPLSNIFNEAPVLIVEGEDDERVWQQAVRSSDGAISIYPVACEGVTAMSDYEREVRHIIEAVYDDARAYSLRDRDGTDGEIADEAPFIRMKLACRAAENLLLSAEVLAKCDLTWQEAIERMDVWIEANTTHARHGEMVAFQSGGYDRMGWDLKNLRVLLCGVILNSTKSWEVLVGQVIGRLAPLADGAPAAEESIRHFLGDKVVTNLLPAPTAAARTA